MNRTQACVGLGGNLGEVARTLAAALEALDGLADTRLLAAIHRRHAAGAVIGATDAGLLLMPPAIVAALDLAEVDAGLLADPAIDPHIEWLGL